MRAFSILPTPKKPNFPHPPGLEQTEKTTNTKKEEGNEKNQNLKNTPTVYHDIRALLWESGGHGGNMYSNSYVDFTAKLSCKCGESS